VDTYTNPRQYIKNNYIKYGLYLPDLTDRRAQLLPLDETLKNVYDPYAFVRDAFLEHRAYLVSDGKVTEAPLQDPDTEIPGDTTPSNTQEKPTPPPK
jgi:phospholipid-binding lipoprotein MlaA